MGLSLRAVLLGGPAALAVAVIAIIVSGSIGSKEDPCSSNEYKREIILLGESHVDPCQFFSESYQEAREKFRDAVKQQPEAKLYSYEVFENYTTDIAVLPGNMPGLVVHTSGVHGVEAYAGSAIQIAWLEHSRKKENTPTVVLVHAVNPYGMAKYRRVDQDNVDLNRNALRSWDPDTQIMMKRNSKLYQEFDESLFYPRNREPTLMDLRILFLWHAVLAIVQHGYGKLKAAMVTGQYDSPQGVFYGGSKLQPSHQLLYNFIKDSVIPFVDLKDAPVTWIDVHTGLGKVQGMDTLLLFADGDKEGASIMQDIARHFVNASIQDEGVSAGYEWVIGTADSLYASLFENAWMLSQEFGTIPSIAVAKALVLENMAHQFFGDEKPQLWSDLLRKAFYPRTKAFRARVLLRGIAVLEQSLERSNKR